MRKALFLPLLVLGLAAPIARSQNASVTGRWVISSDFYGTPVTFPLELKQDGDKLTGNFDGDKLEGTIQNGSIHFLAKDDQNGTEECTAKLQGDTLSGTLVFADADNPEPPISHPFTAKIVPPRPAGPPQRHEFTPTVYYRQFSAYEGEITIDPSNGVVLRLMFKALGLKETDPIVKADILVEYGPVELGGKTYICPVKGIALSLASEIMPSASKTVDAFPPLQTSLNDVVFEQYHLYHASSHIVPTEKDEHLPNE